MPAGHKPSQTTALPSYLTLMYTYLQGETKAFIPGYNPVSGLMNRAEMAKARKTIPPMIVTMEIKEESLNQMLCSHIKRLEAKHLLSTGGFAIETLY